jgi:ankyrin repeat protein
MWFCCKASDCSDLIKICLASSQGCHLEFKSHRGMTVLMYAPRSGHPRCILDANIVPHRFAVFCRWLETVRELLKSGADIETTDPDGMTPFLMACADGSFEIARLLLDSGANIHAASNFDGQRALQYAAFEGHLAIVQELISRGHDINAYNRDGRTSLAFAAYKGRALATQPRSEPCITRHQDSTQSAGSFWRMERTQTWKIRRDNRLWAGQLSRAMLRWNSS